METVADLDNDPSGDYHVNKTDLTYDPHRETCEILDSDWICSNGSINLSLCFKICSDDATEHKRCICKEGSCSWYQKGSQCMIETPVPDLTSPTNTDAMNDVLSTMDQSTMNQSMMAMSTMDQTNSTTGDPPGSLEFSNFPSLDSKTDLMSLIHQINVNSSGNINVNFQLK